MSDDKTIVEIAKNHIHDGTTSLVLSSGVRARIVPVAAGLLEEAQSSIKPPPVPKWFNPDKQKEEENPNDPSYLEALRELDAKRTRAALDILIMFGVVLLDENGDDTCAPEEGAWIGRLKWLERRGQIDLSGLDLSDDIDREFAYKKYVAVLAPDLNVVLRKSGFSEEDVQAALESFPDNEERRTNTGRRSKRGR